MARTDPTANLSWCESHVVIKAVLPDSTVLRLGSAFLEYVPEDSPEDTHEYVAKITKDSEVKMSITSESNQATFEAENVDKELGVTLNNVSSTLIGAKVTCSKVFADVQEVRTPTTIPNLEIWYAANKQTALPNAVISSLTDFSGNARHATGSGPTFTLNQANGLPTFSFDTPHFLTIPSTFALAQVFVVYKTSIAFRETSFLGSSTSGFQFANGTSQFEAPFPRAVRKNGDDLSSPFDIGSSSSYSFVSIKTNDPTAVRSYLINKLGSIAGTVDIAEIIGFSEDLDDQQQEYIETYLSQKYAIALPYIPFRTWERKVLLVGEISSVQVDEQTASISIVSDIAPNVAFISGRAIQSHCPLIFKSVQCGYSGGLTTCNKIYDSVDGCAGRENQFRFGGVIIKGELAAPIAGGVDTVVGVDNRFGNGGGGDGLGGDIKFPYDVYKVPILTD